VFATVHAMDDRVLGARLLAGDDSALVEIFDRLGPFVVGLARRLTGSSSMAEDVMQEVFAALWTQPERFDPDRGSLRAYLGVMSHRRSVDAIRRSSSQQRREEKVASQDAAAAGHEDTADVTAIAESVQAAVAQLPQDQRRAVELAFWQGMTHQEIARALGIPEGTVKSRLRLAQSKLRDRLSGLAMVVA
jgi:RNA polymerase sigma-70 factor, ECF subfamily